MLEALYEWENEQDKPSSRVLNIIDEKMPQDGDTDETADEAGDAPEAEEAARSRGRATTSSRRCR